ncbi:head maturation protease, ClpP-related [Roseovarius sp. MMSF_3281]|uniref:head maturation protease, ClpP-related n=1 Tax=Roseovarius sp. MMSF_3281 TaxID=3046694 RepID=UPI00273D327C|nr:head maturation protease, ClpP-related [Roseovarius sp. MMSF_3281]
MKRDLPKVEVGARPGVRSDISLTALNRWSPDLRAEANDDASISILDPIGADIWGDGVTAKRIAGALRSIGDRPVTVNINSPGGDVFEGLAIYNLLREHSAEVTVKVLGLAASAASVIAMAGDQVRIGRAAFLMIHNSWVLAMGDRNALREVADWLEPFDTALADVYHARTGIDAAKLSTMMDQETWINGQGAVDQGFADDLLAADQITVDGDAEAAKALRAEKQFDILAARAGLPRSAARDLLREVKGGMPGATPTHMPEAVDIVAEINGLRASLKT